MSAMSAVSARPLVRFAQALTAGLLLVGVVAAPPARATEATDALQRADTNPTGTASGSSPNGVGGLALSLTALSDGRIKVTWKRPGPASRIKHFLLQVGPTRKLDRDVKNYKINRRKQAATVLRAVDAGATSGNYSFVKITAIRKNGSKGGSPTKWIQAPLAYACTAAATDRVRIATFNVRTWKTDSTDKAKGFGWDVRGPNVIKEIRRSGARIVALQEASGKGNLGNGPLPQHEWIVNALNDALPDDGANWVDGVSANFYIPPAGQDYGLTGTRVIYDANRYDELAEGLIRIPDPQATTSSLMPWVRLQAKGGTQAPFVVSSNHLRVGEGRKEFDIRGRQVAKTIAGAKNLRSMFPADQIVLGGDFNSTANTLPFNNVQRAILAAGFYDAYATRTLQGSRFPTSNMYKFPLSPTPHRRDYLFTLGGPKGSCAYTNQTYPAKSQVASDHFLQVATLPLRHL